MSKIQKSDIVAAIDDVLDGKPVLKWDYLVSINHKDPFVRTWALRMRQLEQQYSDLPRGILLTGDGLEKLKQLREELLACR
jgi:hypothetical protein